VNNKDLDLVKVVTELERCVDTDGRTFVLFWLYSPTTSTSGPASLTKIEPLKQFFVGAALASESELVPKTPAKSGLWEVRFTVMTFDEAKTYATRVELEGCFDTIWKKETRICH
jgi:hypothetical protein